MFIKIILSNLILKNHIDFSFICNNNMCYYGSFLDKVDSNSFSHNIYGYGSLTIIKNYDLLIEFGILLNLIIVRLKGSGVSFLQSC